MVSQMAEREHVMLELDGHERRAIVDGDATSAAIAAASIVAKVTRDRYMRRADERHPGWEFAAHVGYSTPEHRAAIRRLGVSPLHRLSFQSVAYQQFDLLEAAAAEHLELTAHESERSLEVVQAQ